MQRNKKEIIEKGTLVARNPNADCGHFYLYGNEIFRALPNRDEHVYPIVTKSELRKMIKNGVLLPGVTMEEIEKEIDVTTESAKTEENEWCLLKAVNALKAKFAKLEKALNDRLKTEPVKK